VGAQAISRLPEKGAFFVFPFAHHLHTGRLFKTEYALLHLSIIKQSMEVICLHDEAFYSLIEKVVARIKEQHVVKEDKWISGDDAMKKLRVKSKTTMQKLRDEGQIRFSKPDRRTILYDINSINAYLDKHARETF
jgi:hypothetical protein